MFNNNYFQIKKKMSDDGKLLFPFYTKERVKEMCDP